MKLDQSNGEENGGDLHSPLRPASPQKRRTGKVARLPRKLRDLINELLSEGLTYTEIIQRLKESSDPPLPYDISERNLSNWHTGGFQDWERHQDRMDLMATKFDFAMDLAQTTEPHKLQELSLQLAAVRMCEFLSDLAIADPPAVRIMSFVNGNFWYQTLPLNRSPGHATNRPGPNCGRSLTPEQASRESSAMACQLQPREPFKSAAFSARHRAEPVL